MNRQMQNPVAGPHRIQQFRTGNPNLMQQQGPQQAQGGKQPPRMLLQQMQAGRINVQPGPSSQQQQQQPQQVPQQQEQQQQMQGNVMQTPAPPPYPGPPPPYPGNNASVQPSSTNQVRTILQYISHSFSPLYLSLSLFFSLSNLR